MNTQKKNKKVKKRLITLGILLSIVLFLILGCFYMLSMGVSIQKLNIANIELRGFYLKLDNKLILTLDTLKIKESKHKVQPNLPNTIRWFQNSLIGISYFERIDIQNIILPNGQKASIFYDGKEYNLIFPNVQALFQLQQDPHKINLKIQKLVFNEPQLQVNGQMSYQTLQNKISFSLIAYSNEEAIKKQEKFIIEGDSNLQILNIRAFSTPIQDLKAYEEEIKKIPTLHQWLIQRASFKNIRVKNLFFSAPLNENFIPRMLKSLYAELDLEEIFLKFHPELSPVTASALKIKFQNGILKFELDHPYYENLNLQGSFVEIHSLADLTQKSKTLISLHSNEVALDEKMHQILRAYDIDFDIHQLDSTLDMSLELWLQTQEDQEISVQANGTLTSKQTHLNVFGTPVFSEYLNVVLDIDENKQYISVNDTAFQIQSPHIQGLINLDIDLLQKNIKGNLNPKLIKINTSNSPSSPLDELFILNQEDLSKIQVEADFSDIPSISIPDFGIKLSFDEENRIDLKNLSKLYPYSPFLNHLAIQNGEASIMTKDFETFDIYTGLSHLNYPLFDQKWERIEEIYAHIKINPKLITFSSLDESITLKYQNQTLQISLLNKNFDFQALQDASIPVLNLKTENNKISTQNDQTSKNSFKLYLESKNSSIRYKNFIVPTDEIIANIKDHKTTLDATYKNGVINLDFYDDIIKFKANNFSGNFVNLVAQKELVQGGLFSARGLYKNKTLKAEIEMQNTIFKNFATLQNVVALIDTVPSLIVFKKPGFSTKGYQITKGRILLELNKDYLGLKKIDLIGDTIDVNGGGLIELATQNLNLSLTISTIKNLSEVLSKIPIVGYLLLGKEGKISTSLILRGTLQNPKSEITLAEDILSAPFKIIERIFIPDDKEQK